MERDFWVERWNEGRIGFHQDRVHPDLTEHAHWFLDDGPHAVLVPLSGKTLDLPWLSDRGHDVVGAEFSDVAIRALFDEHGRTPTVTQQGDHTVYRSESLEVWGGDFFDLTPETLGRPFTRVWDRAALVALPPRMREAYVAQVRRLAPGGVILLNALEYEPSVMSGPPFSVPPDDVSSLFADDEVGMLGQRDLTDGWRERGHQWFTSWLYRIRLREP